MPRDVVFIGLATGRRDPQGMADPLVYPRLIDWSEGILESPFSDCAEESAPPFLLFRPRCGGVIRPRCPGYAIAESSPGLGRCVIEITTPEAVMCDPTRGWANPLASNGSRRPRITKMEERICEVMPVEAGAMDACIHDETCADCGGGWCVTKVLPLAKFCGDSAPLPIRWVGGALPAPGRIHITCLEEMGQ